MSGPQGNPTEDQQLKLAVIVSDCSHVVHAGGDIVTEVRTFDLTPEAAAFIAEARKMGYTQVGLAVHVEVRKP